MKKNVMRKNLLQTIRSSLTRYIAIAAIIALGAAMFVGLRSTKSDMVATGQMYTDAQNMFDLRLLNTYGWTQTHLDAIRQMEGVVDAEGTVSLDVLASRGQDTKEQVYKLYSIPERVNKVYLLGGRMPQAPDECLADGFHATDAILGTTFTISEKNDEATLESLTQRTFTVVGYVSTPLYMDMTRGNTTLGNGSVASYIYLPAESFDVDYYTEINITIPGDYQVYTRTYNDAMDLAAERFEPLLKPLAMDRYTSVRDDAWEEYNKGLAEYNDGYAEFLEGRQEALLELEKGRLELVEGRDEIESNRVTLAQAEAELIAGQKLLNEKSAELALGRTQLAQSKAAAFSQLASANAQLLENYKMVTSNLQLVKDGLSQIDSGLSQLDSGIQQLESGLQQIDMMISLMDTMSGVLAPSVSAAQSALDRAKEVGAPEETIAQLEAALQELKDQQAQYDTQKADLQANRDTYSKQLEELKVQREELVAQRQELEANQLQLEDALTQIDAGFLELQNSQTQAENQFAAAEAQIEAGMIQMEASQRELDAGMAEIESGKLQLAQAEKDLEEGWEQYRQGRDEALSQLGEAELQLSQAQAQLHEAKKTLDSMKEPAVYVLTRNTNVGYLSLESSSDIVQGISTVFPAFFLLIAALVCITTMTRMVDEERTQIGTLKALGYTNGEIIRKYLLYSGSAAVVGCGLGVLIGSAVFPMILWEAYKIMLCLTPGIMLRVDWGLCLLVVGAYTAVNLLVTWYCCRMTLREVPAELIRPKAPTTGKKIFLEHLPFWNKISFLNKVMLRNIFRYRQRLLMMLVGIGGCTALLLTGFGVRDSIVDIVSFQYSEITLYDMEVRFDGEMTQQKQAEFREEVGRYVDQIGFFHQSSVELDFDGATRDIVMIAGGEDIAGFLDFHSGEEALSLPGEGQALISVGAAEKMGISVGDTVSVRDADMRSLTLTVSGIYDNYVQNFVVISPETAAAQWGEAPQIQMACITVRADQDVHEASAQISDAEGVMNVTVSADMAEQVGSMLKALDLVVVTVVVCAALLAITVLYNLTNINITERIREIATIKVLGFNSAESAAYVFKENLLLSAMGAFVGLFGGRLLLEFVMSQIKVDMVWFQARLVILSYILAVVLTMLSACIVDFILYFKLEKINMAEALKSVE